MVKVNLNVRVEKSEMEILENYAQQMGRIKTDIIREYMLEFGDSSPTPSPI